MIQAKDLRIGNWIKRQDGLQVQISNIGRKGTNIGPDEFPVYLYWEMCDSIPLTPEILENCGFVLRNGNYNTWYAKALIGFSSTMRISVHDDIYYFSPFEWNYQIEIKSLHQLQNLYYALTGEELTYKQ
jgi:hypothetical protein